MSLNETPARVWPFPPPTGPVPWTPKQEAEYRRQQRDEAEEAPW
jgi:hypothetical protein